MDVDKALAQAQIIAVDNHYDIVIGDNIINSIPSDLLKKCPSSTYVILCDTTIETIITSKLVLAFDNVLANNAMNINVCVGL